MKHLIATLCGIAAICTVSLSGCSTSQLAKAQSAITTVSTDAAKLSADEPAAIAAVTAVTGSSSTVTNAASYVSTIATDAQTLAPLLSAALTLFTTADTSGHRVWNAEGIAALHRYHIRANDPKALAKLERIYNLSGPKGDVKPNEQRVDRLSNNVGSGGSPGSEGVRLAQNSLASN